MGPRIHNSIYRNRSMNHIAIGNKIAKLCNEHFKWSDETFGDSTNHSAIGTLKHLAKEVQEIIADPSDIEEWADAGLLWLDGGRRAGHSVEELLDAMYAKLQKNKLRTWSKPSSPDESIEHIRSEDITKGLT